MQVAYVLHFFPIAVKCSPPLPATLLAAAIANPLPTRAAEGSPRGRRPPVRVTVKTEAKHDQGTRQCGRNPRRPKAAEAAMKTIAKYDQGTRQCSGKTKATCHFTKTPQKP